jgi:uncharacterized integral membrane protein (TIGR00698 family)
MEISLHISRKTKIVLFTILLLGSLSPFISPAVALFAGIVFSLVIRNPFPDATRENSSRLLQASVVGLGFGMNMHEALQTGLSGIGISFVSVIMVLASGYMIGKLLKINRITSYLISVGTAICGGSAIATISPVIRAKEEETTVSLVTIFALNALALVLFPVIGHSLNLTQHQFGLWAAVAIHDTSSVVGAGHTYGAEALQVATTVKLTRALWIIPLALFSALIFRNKEERIRIPWFILLFVAAMTLQSYLPFRHCSPIGL